ncbi:MAG: ABC transporter permease, partial [Candidatus Heimdallarchaeota archaeon]|nr:ABC transporter permease [Candidatus Heimdallarchaeota archaeon]
MVVITFFIGRLLPGNPFIYQVRRMSDAQYQIYLSDLEKYGLNETLWTQFTLYITNFFTGDWGKSWILARDAPAMLLVQVTLPTTLELMIISLIFSLVVGKKIGTLAVRSSAKKKNQLARLLSILISAVPIIVFSQLLIVLSVKLKWYKYVMKIKTFGMPDPVFVTGSRLLDSLIGGEWAILLDTLIHYIVPVFVLSLPMIVLISRPTRSSVMEVVHLDYIRTAHAKGAPEDYIIRKHIMPNSRIVTISTFGMAIPLFLSNAALVEIIFQLPGFARLLINALTFKDYNVIISAFAVLSFIVVLGNTISDIMFAVVDPRIRLQ